MADNDYLSMLASMGDTDAAEAQGLSQAGDAVTGLTVRPIAAGVAPAVADMFGVDQNSDNFQQLQQQLSTPTTPLGQATQSGVGSVLSAVNRIPDSIDAAITDRPGTDDPAARRNYIDEGFSVPAHPLTFTQMGTDIESAGWRKVEEQLHPDETPAQIDQRVQERVRIQNDAMLAGISLEPLRGPAASAAGFASDAGRAIVADDVEAALQRPALTGKPPGTDPNAPLRAVVDNYKEANGIQTPSPTDYIAVNPDTATKVAQAYEDMPHQPAHPDVKDSYDALKKESNSQLDALLQNGYKIDVPSAAEYPYSETPRAALEDLRENRHLSVYPTDASDTAMPADHPLMERAPFFVGENGQLARGTAADYVARAFDNLSPKDLDPTTPSGRMVAKVQANPQAFWEWYKNYNEHGENTQGGKVLSTDTIRAYSDDYAKDRTLSGDVHEASSALTKALHEYHLDRPLAPGEENRVVYTGGGAGAGKSTGLEKMSEANPEYVKSARMVYDSNITSAKSAGDRIDSALRRGNQVQTLYTYRDPYDALVNGALRRAENQRAAALQKGLPPTGRTMSVETFAETHTKSNQAVRDLDKRFGQHPNYDTQVIDNSHGKGNSRTLTLDQLPRVSDNLTEKLRNVIEDQYRQRKISADTRAGFLETGPSGSRVRAGSVRRAEQVHQADSAGSRPGPDSAGQLARPQGNGGVPQEAGRAPEAAPGVSPGAVRAPRQVTYNDVFRAVHDAFGHAPEGLGFGPHGEYNAWRQHAAVYSPRAQLALANETLGQNSWVNYGPHGEANRANPRETVYAPQKTGLLPSQLIEEARSAPAPQQGPRLADMYPGQRGGPKAERQTGVEQSAGRSVPPAGREAFLDEFDRLPSANLGAKLVGNASVRISKDPFRDDTVSLEYLRAHKTGEGHGGDAMRQLTDLADKHGVRMELDAAPLDGPKGIPAPKLQKFYEGHGFTAQPEQASVVPGSGMAREALAPAKPSATMEFRHFSNAHGDAGTVTLDPKFYGTGLPGAEAKRVAAGAPKTTSAYGMNTAAQHIEFGPGTPEYRIKVPTKKMYDLSADPKGLAQFNESGSYDHSATEQAIKDAGFTGYHLPNGEGGFQGQARFFKPVQATRVDALGRESPNVPAPIAEHLTDRELAQANRSKSTAGKVADIFDQLPSTHENAAVALSGQAAKGWYRRASQFLSTVYGGDAPRFTALLAALSPQTSVQMNFRNAVHVFHAWDEAGRPQDPAAIRQLMNDHVQKNPEAEAEGRESALGAWIPNATRALTSANPEAEQFELSGPKVDSFMRNLRNDVHAVTLDTHMAQLAAMEQKVLSASGNQSGPGKTPTYLAYSARVRQTAKFLSGLTGEKWTPEEVQETMWSWKKTADDLHKGQMKDDEGNVIRPDLKGKPVSDMIRDGDLTDELVRKAANFPDLLPQFEDFLKTTGGGRYAGAVRKAVSQARAAQQSAAPRQASPPLPPSLQKPLAAVGARMDDRLMGAVPF